MNTADSAKIADMLQSQGFQPAVAMNEADIIVVNSCVVRQKAEDKALALINSIKSLKKHKHDLSIAVTGCLVDSNLAELKERLPHVSLFFGPQEFQKFEQWLSKGDCLKEEKEDFHQEKTEVLPVAFVPIIKGCDSFCSYCIVPYRRGREVSRLPDELIEEARCLVLRGAREITLLGQNVDSYGHDLPSRTDLADLLIKLEEIPGLYRVRFLTSHPKFLREKLIYTISNLKKTCPFFNLPVQSGDDAILSMMKRGYSVEEYKKLIHLIRAFLPGAAISTDIIVGFPGEKEENFQNTIRLLEEVKFDNIHAAAYSPRSGTLAARTMIDDVPAEEKKRRLQLAEQIQERIASEINSALEGKSVEVLVERRKKGKWEGRTRTNKLVFFAAPDNLTGKLVLVKIERTSPWSLSGKLESVTS